MLKYVTHHELLTVGVEYRVKSRKQKILAVTDSDGNTYHRQTSRNYSTVPIRSGPVYVTVTYK